MELTQSQSELVRALARMAGYHLQQGPDFPVTGAQMDTSGKLGLCKPSGLKADAPLQHRIEVLMRAFRSSADAGDLVACAYCAPVTVTHPKSEEQAPCILVSVECDDGTAVDVFVPFTKNPALNLGTPFSVTRDGQIFSADPVSSTQES